LEDPGGIVRAALAPATLLASRFRVAVVQEFTPPEVSPGLGCTFVDSGLAVASTLI
jgi:hypothetical protein